MRLFYFLLPIMLSSPVFAQDCYDVLADCPTGSLYINQEIDLTGTSGSAIDITVNGDVIISKNIILNGSNGSHIHAASGTGGPGGPGASGGGGLSSGSAESGDGFTPSDGGPGDNNAICNSGGGGGGGAYSSGKDGLPCNPSDPVGAAGISSGFPPFSGGFGGGSGGAFETSTLIFELGAGGGGGGGLHITATGTITIKNGVTISARGGNGGTATSFGGGGGGGGGGIIWLQSSVAIKNSGILDVRGGIGGKNTKSSTPRGGRGGNGGDGIYRLEVNGDVETGHGYKNFGSSSSLKSDISCGTIGAAKASDHKNENLQLMMGFALALLMGAILKTLSRFRELL